MEVLLLEAQQAYDGEIVVELQSDDPGDIKGNLERIETWIRNWMQAQVKDAACNTLHDRD